MSPTFLLFYYLPLLLNLYIDYCSNNELPCEIIKTNFKFDKSMTISELINYSQSNLINKQKNTDKVKLRLFELITLFSRLCAIEITKIKKLENYCDEYDFGVLRFFALTNGYSIRNEKIIRRIYEFSDFSLKIAVKLSLIYQKKYGKKESANAKTSLLDGHCILVSGADLDELEKLLKTIDEMDIKEKINVYTHGPLFLAHFYPYFTNAAIIAFCACILFSACSKIISANFSITLCVISSSLCAGRQ